MYRYRQNDFAPYIFHTNDYGTTWERLTDGRNGIPSDRFVRVVREDPDRQGLLYAGTEFGLYVSFDEGAHWQSLQLNLPITPVTDLAVHREDLVVATQGRSFWVLEDLSVLHRLDGQTSTSTPHLFVPSEAHRSGAGPAAIYLYLDELPDEPVAIEILDAQGSVVADLIGRADDADEDSDSPNATITAGMNRVTWNLRYDPLFRIPDGIVIWGQSEGRPRVVPGGYRVQASAGSWSDMQSIEVKADPRLTTTQAEYEEQFELAKDVGLRIADLYAELLRLREIKQQATDIGARMQRAGHGDEVAEAAEALSVRLTAIEGELTQLEGEGGQDALNFPGRLDNQFVVLYSNLAETDRRPSAGVRERYQDISPGLAELLEELDVTIETEVPRFNELVRSKGVAPIIVKQQP